MNVETVPPVGAPGPVPAWTALLAAVLFFALGALDILSPAAAESVSGPAAMSTRVLPAF
jgi:hypothetical protein